MVDRGPVITAEELDSLDPGEMVEGYGDGFAGEPEPGDNRSKAYWHGWRNGSNDRAGRVDVHQTLLVRDLRGKGRIGPGYHPSRAP